MNTYIVRFWGPSHIGKAYISTVQQARNADEALKLALGRHQMSELDIDSAMVSEPR